jgi:hypothetical protein
MEQAYWLGRNRASLAMAQSATNSKARLIHYELAGAYSVKAADSADEQRRSQVPDSPSSKR